MNIKALSRLDEPGQDVDSSKKDWMYQVLTNLKMGKARTSFSSSGLDLLRMFLISWRIVTGACASSYKGAFHTPKTY